MGFQSRMAGTCAVVAALSASLSAQWPLHPPSSAPVAPGGEINLTAPTPRMPDGKPDLSGVWQTVNLGTTQPIVGADTGPLGRTSLFWNIGNGIEGDLPFQPWARALRAERVAANSQDNPDAHCLPIGITQLHNHPQPRKIVQTRDLIVILYEANAGVRQIFLDGRALPRNDPQPWWFGYSIGRWEGDTLVVTSSGFRDGAWLDINGSPLTDAGTITEHIRRVDHGHLEIDVTVDDQKAYTRPWTARTIHQQLMPGDELIEFVCQENEQSSQHFQ